MNSLIKLKEQSENEQLENEALLRLI